MKKLFLILAILCLGVIMPMVIAATQTQTQDVSVTVAEVTELTIAPSSLDFGLARPLVPKAGQEVTFNAAGSNVDVRVSSSVEQGSVFEYIDFLIADVIQNIKTFSISLPISSQQGTAGTQILLPTGLVPGLRTGIITYTITSTFCGDNMKNGYETCDGTDLNGQTCELQGFDGGTLACNALCTGFDTSLCTTTPICTPETDVAFCERQSKTCGDVTANDNCEVARTVNCGTCETGNTCISGTCTLIPTCNAGELLCNNVCVVEDANNCGTCGNVCAQNQTCTLGVCVAG